MSCHDINWPGNHLIESLLDSKLVSFLLNNFKNNILISIINNYNITDLSQINRSIDLENYNKAVIPNLMNVTIIGIRK